MDTNINRFTRDNMNTSEKQRYEKFNHNKKYSKGKKKSCLD